MVVEAIDSIKHAALLQDLARNMRDKDRAECADARMAPHAALCECVRLSEMSFVAYEETAALWAFGVTPSGCAWLLGARAADKRKKAIVRLSREIARLFIEYYGRLYNRAPVSYGETVRWLGWLGAKFGGKETVSGREYIYFTLGGE